MSTPEFDPNDVKAWRTIVHKTAQALKDNPNDAEAREWQQRALQNIDELEQVAAAQDTRREMDMGGAAAFGLGAARAMSFGLGDAFQRYGLSPEERQGVQTTEGEHRTATTLGEVAGSAVPYVLGAGMGANALRARTLIGAAQGAGVTRGDVAERAKGAILGGAIAAGAPVAFRAASGMVGRGRGLLSRAAGALLRSEQAAPEVAAAKAAPETATALEPTIPEPARMLHPDIRQAIADFNAHKISGRELRDAIDFANGNLGAREPVIPQRSTATPISQGSPGASRQAAEVHPATLPEPAASPRAPQPVRPYQAPPEAFKDPSVSPRGGMRTHRVVTGVGAPPGSQSESARTAYVMAERAGASNEAATVAARRAAGRASEVLPQRSEAAATRAPSPLEGLMEASRRVDQLFKGPPTPEGAAEIQDIVRRYGRDVASVLLQKMPPAWRAAS